MSGFTVRLLLRIRNGILSDLEDFVWADSDIVFNILYWFEEQLDKLIQYYWYGEVKH